MKDLWSFIVRTFSLTQKSRFYFSLFALLFAQGAPVSYFGYLYLNHHPNTAFLELIPQLWEEHYQSILFIHLGTSLFFTIFGYIVGSLYHHALTIDQQKTIILSLATHDLKNSVNQICYMTSQLKSEDTSLSLIHI